MRRQVLLPQLLAVVTFRKLGPASGIQFNSLSYHLINSDDVHHHAVSLDRDSARQLRCWGGDRCVAASPRCRPSQDERWRLPLSLGQTVCRAPRATALADMFIIRPPTHTCRCLGDRIPGQDTFPEHPNILQCLLRGPIPHITLSHIPCLQFRASPPAYRPRLIPLPHPQEEHAPVLLTTCTRVGETPARIQGPLKDYSSSSSSPSSAFGDVVRVP